MAKRVCLNDGSYELNRSFYSHTNLASSTGIPTGAIYGTIKILKSLREKLQPDIEIFFTDYSRHSFRTDIYPEYKGNRSETDVALKQQFALMEDFCKRANLLCVKKEGYEADDLIGTYAKYYAELGYEVYIVTGDKDLLQLISDNISVLYSSSKDGWVIYDAQKCKETMGVSPSQIVDLKAICGDSADNYKGIPGVGPKTAITLLNDFGNLDGIYEHIAEIKGKTKEKFLNNKEIAYLCQTLATINCSVPDIFIPEYSKLTFTVEAKDFLNALDIKQI